MRIRKEAVENAILFLSAKSHIINSAFRKPAVGTYTKSDSQKHTQTHTTSVNALSRIKAHSGQS